MKNKTLLRIIGIITIILFLGLSNIFSQDLWQGDLGIRNHSNYNIEATIFAVSIPFEGLVQPEFAQNNRVDTLQNGSTCRLFAHNNSSNTYKMDYYHQILAPTNQLELALVGNNPSSPNNAFGHGIYEIVIYNTYNYKTYKAYFNCADSKYGTIIPGGTYGRDFNFNYEDNYVELTANDQHVADIYEWIEGTSTIQEFKVWDIIFHENDPLERRFYARSTPFGISPNVLEQSYDRQLLMREYFIGTKVIFDRVYNSYGAADRWGYNTINSSPYHSYFSNPPIIPGHNSEGNTYVTPSWYSKDLYTQENIFGCKIIARTGDEIVLKENKRLWISGYNDNSDNGDTLVLKNGSIVTKEINAQLNACFGGTILDYGAINYWNNNSFSKIFEHSELSFLGLNHIINGGQIEIDGNGRLIIGDNTTVTFDGSSASLKLNPNSNVKLGTNSKIEFKNGANFVANNSNIMTPVNVPSGYGIVLEDPGAQTSITNCTFNNLKNSIRFVNNNIPVTSELKMNIIGNTFNTNSSCDKVIEIKNARNINILDNVINMGNDKGYGLLMRYPYDLLTEESNQAYYGINISNNTINDGFISVTILGLTNAIIPINFIGNTLNSNSGSFSNFLGGKITGVIRNNHFNSSSSSGNFRNMDLNISVPNVINNTFSSSNVNIINTLSYPKLAPVMESTTDNGFIWVGGKNTINSTNNGNIQFYGGFATLDWGMNCFTKGSNAQYYMWDYVSILQAEGYYMRQNSFNGNINPSGLLFNLFEYNNHETRVTPFFGGATFECSNPSNVGDIWEIRDLGDGLKDTIYKTPNTTGVQPTQDEMLYTLSYQEQISNNFFEAITYLKVLINNYPYSEYINNALSDLYTSYQQLDTSGNQNIRNILYNDLKNYLDNKILSGNYNYEFNYNAYDITLMCMSNMTEYNEAMSGYELIALYHPDPVIRLLASWDYAEIQALLNSSGSISGKEENMMNSEYLSLLTKRVKSSIGEDPVKQKVFKSFKNAKKEMDSGLEKGIKTKTKDNKTARAEINRIKNEESKIDLRTISNIRYSKTQSKEEREKNQLEDLIFAKQGNIKVSENIDSKLPTKYELSQNYPNPFNPSTTIKYSLPKNGLVTIKIFDVTGREIKTLVNEIKQAGNYAIDFNGSLLSSGVYFYRIQSGDFVMTKRMVLVK